MEPTKVIAAALVVVLAAGGAAAGVAYPGAMDDQAASADAPTNVDAVATLDNGTVTVTVTDAGDPLPNASASANDEVVGTTDANGTVTFDLGDADELEIELEKAGFEGELKYRVQNDSLHLVEESYEYDHAEDEYAREDDEHASDRAEEHRSPNADDGAENADQARSENADDRAHDDHEKDDHAADDQDEDDHAEDHQDEDEDE